MPSPDKPTLNPNPFADFGRRTSRETLFTEHASPAHKKFLKQFLHEPPPPKGNAEFDLARIIGDKAVAAIQKERIIRFHAVGDTGRGTHSAQEDVAKAMIADFATTGNKTGPAFFLHLGDVTYGPNKESVLYRTQFYEPYTDYPRKIVAIVLADNFLSGVPTMLSAVSGRPPIAKMSESALAAAISPYWNGSSTIGVKKSTVCTRARERSSW